MLNKKFVNFMQYCDCYILLAFFVIHLLKPDLMYNNEGGFRPFGLGYKHKQ